MAVDPANAHELARIASEVGADVLEGALRYPSDCGGWQLGDIDLNEYLDRYRDQRLVLIIAPVGEAEAATYTCGVCGFVMNEVGECPSVGWPFWREPKRLEAAIQRWTSWTKSRPY